MKANKLLALRSEEPVHIHSFVRHRGRCGVGARASFFAFVFSVLELLSAPVKLCFHPACFSSELLSASISCVEDFASSWKISLKPFDRMSTPVSMEGDNIENAIIETGRHENQNDDHLHSYVGSQPMNENNTHNDDNEIDEVVEKWTNENQVDDIEEVDDVIGRNKRKKRSKVWDEFKEVILPTGQKKENLLQSPLSLALRLVLTHDMMSYTSLC
ncbi:hypothetical protein KFK09_002072 [Dendrobium nobile]|uniref:Uncharacterized protein n=1 Tax=Dendrobium nobile TaxID=94219 RepID=A0A8T3C6R0_DENNO|nr:hypothetical protein KFK09_002072 [Dendrobium nobile]